MQFFKPQRFCRPGIGHGPTVASHKLQSGFQLGLRSFQLDWGMVCFQTHVVGVGGPDHDRSLD